MKPTDFAGHLTNFLTVFLPVQKNASKNTISSYRDTFKLLIVFCDSCKRIKAEKITMATLSSETINEFLYWLETDRRCSISTRNQRLAAIHSFFRYAQVESPSNILHFQKVIAIPVKKAPKPNVEHLTPDSMKLLLCQPDRTSIKGRRDLTLLSVLYDTGARVQELIGLRVRDVRLDTPAVVTIHGKGNKTRVVPIMKDTASLLESYLRENKLIDEWKNEFPVFTNSQGNALTKEGVAFIIAKY
ncbi:MAG: site-specific integrase [Defluviitaleaceae bacterium]|nr:site-specific integrase [Defluviitaleaceae bacterium]